MDLIADSLLFRRSVFERPGRNGKEVSLVRYGISTTPGTLISKHNPRNHVDYQYNLQNWIRFLRILYFVFDN